MQTPRNFVAKYMNEVNRGGKHQDRRRRERTGQTKHRKDYRSDHHQPSKTGDQL